MSTICKVTNILKERSASSAEINFAGIGLALLQQGLDELNLAYEKQKELQDCDDQIKQVDLLIKTVDEKYIGIYQDDEGINFISNDINSLVVNDTIKKIKQRYSKHILLHELKSKGYDKIKEEKLPNGSIRMVVEKWE